MDKDTEVPVASDVLPAAVVEILDQLDEAELRAAIDYAQDRLRYVHPTITEQIESEPDKEIVRVIERPGYADVIRKEPLGENGESQYELFHYRVYEEQRPEGGTHLHWVYLGQIHK